MTGGFNSDENRKAFFAGIGQQKHGIPFSPKSDIPEKKISDYFKKSPEQERLKEKVNSFKVSSTGQKLGEGSMSRTSYKEGILGIPQGNFDQKPRSEARPYDYVPKTNPLRQFRDFAEKRRVESDENKRMKLFEIAKKKKEFQQRLSEIEESRKRVEMEKKLQEQIKQGKMTVKDYIKNEEANIAISDHKQGKGTLPLLSEDDPDTARLLKSQKNREYYEQKSRGIGESPLFPNGYKMMSRGKGGKLSFAMPKADIMRQAINEIDTNGKTEKQIQQGRSDYQKQVHADNPLIQGDSVKKDIARLLSDPSIANHLQSGALTVKDIKRMRKRILRERKREGKEYLRAMKQGRIEADLEKYTKNSYNKPSYEKGVSLNNISDFELQSLMLSGVKV